MPGRSSRWRRSAAVRRHPPSRAPGRSIPRIDHHHRMEPIPGAVLSLLNPPPGCPLFRAAVHGEDRCRQMPRREIAVDHFVACFAVEDGHAAACEVEDLNVHFPARVPAPGCARSRTAKPPMVRAVDGVSFSVEASGQRSGWWANRAAASRRSRAPWSGSNRADGGHGSASDGDRRSRP